ncbi:MAG: AraC family transcriptional regulator [Gammaproteobacteria bacterium]|nr:AraC family transcriptional regulator [Gammaproteobacteria bacterium]
MNFSIDPHIEILVRSAVIGVLFLFCIVYPRRPVNAKDATLLATAACVAGYMVLKMPMLAPETGLLRGILLALADATPFSVWAAGMVWLREDFRFPAPIRVLAVAWAAWHSWFFIVAQGQGVYHVVSHVIAILLMLHLAYTAVSQLQDDLVDTRRKLRITAAVIASVFIVFIATGQLLPGWIDPDLEEFAGAIFILSSVTLVATLLLRSQRANSVEPAGPLPDPSVADDLPPRMATLLKQLDAFLAKGGYLQQGLTIKSLSTELACPQYLLRRLINEHIGYRNFSAFLNAYRIPDACKRLATSAHEPILSIALDLGYGSIGPFNRAFKAATGTTPTEYRQSALNR